MRLLLEGRALRHRRCSTFRANALQKFAQGDARRQMPTALRPRLPGLHPLALALLLFVLPQAASAAEFAKAEANYRLQLPDYWSKAAAAVPLDAVFICDAKVCNKDACQGRDCVGPVQVVIGSLQPPAMRGKS